VLRERPAGALADSQPHRCSNGFVVSRAGVYLFEEQLRRLLAEALRIDRHSGQCGDRGSSFDHVVKSDHAEIDARLEA
jgi:hypothetical protein